MRRAPSATLASAWAWGREDGAGVRRQRARRGAARPPRGTGRCGAPARAGPGGGHGGDGGHGRGVRGAHCAPGARACGLPAALAAPARCGGGRAHGAAGRDLGDARRAPRAPGAARRDAGRWPAQGFQLLAAAPTLQSAQRRPGMCRSLPAPRAVRRQGAPCAPPGAARAGCRSARHRRRAATAQAPSARRWAAASPGWRSSGRRPPARPRTGRTTCTPSQRRTRPAARRSSLRTWASLRATWSC